MGHQGIATNDMCEEDKIEGLQICPSSVEIMSVRNMRGNTSNEWNEINYTEELRKTRNFVPAHDAINSKIKYKERNTLNKRFIGSNSERL